MKKKTKKPVKKTVKKTAKTAVKKTVKKSKVRAKSAVKAVAKAAKTAKKKVAAKKPVKTKKTAKAPKITARKVPKPSVKNAADEAPKAAKFTAAQLTKFRSLLLDLRDHLIDGVSFLANDNLKRSNRDASGELSGYSLHMADAGTDNFDREFALSLVSSEQDALYEIEEALKRIEGGDYGLCETCEKPIPKPRLAAVPFARNCVFCQSNLERSRGRSVATSGVFANSPSAADLSSDDNEE